MAVLIVLAVHPFTLAPAIISGDAPGNPSSRRSQGFPGPSWGKVWPFLPHEVPSEASDQKPLRSRRWTELGQLALLFFTSVKLSQKSQ
jgi:hypothetical protein